MTYRRKSRYLTTVCIAALLAGSLAVRGALADEAVNGMGVGGDRWYVAFEGGAAWADHTNSVWLTDFGTGPESIDLDPAFSGSAKLGKYLGG